MSRIVQIYNKCILSLKTLSEGKKLLFKYVNIWDNQIDDFIQDDENNNYSFALPAAFVEFELGDCKMLGGRVKSYPEAIIRLHIITGVLDGGNGTMEQNLKTFDVTGLVDFAMCFLDVPYCAALMAHENRQDFQHKAIYKHIISYRTHFIDTSGSMFDSRTGSVFAVMDSPTVSFVKKNRSYIDQDGTPYTNQLGQYYTFSG